MAAYYNERDKIAVFNAPACDHGHTEGNYMLGIKLSEQPTKTVLSRGIHGQIFIVTTRPVPEHPDPNRNILCCATMAKPGDPIRRQPGKAIPVTPWARLLYQCREAKQSNQQRIAEAVGHVRWRGFDVFDSV